VRYGLENVLISDYTNLKYGNGGLDCFKGLIADNGLAGIWK
jgi:hypothetical protein